MNPGTESPIPSKHTGMPFDPEVGRLALSFEMQIFDRFAKLEEEHANIDQIEESMPDLVESLWQLDTKAHPRYRDQLLDLGAAVLYLLVHAPQPPVDQSEAQDRPPAPAP